MSKWITWVYAGVVGAYLSYLLIIAGLHTVCDCLR